MACQLLKSTRDSDTRFLKEVKTQKIIHRLFGWHFAGLDVLGFPAQPAQPFGSQSQPNGWEYKPLASRVSSTPAFPPFSAAPLG
jgi:hypothetical protein